MAQPTQFEGSFKKGAVVLSPKSGASLAAVAKQLKADTTLKVQIMIHPDTARVASRKLADRRLQLVSRQLQKLGVRLGQLITVTRPMSATTLVANAAGKSGAASSSSREADAFELNVVGRQALVLGDIQHAVLAPGADERARHADSLTVGGVSNPFATRGMYSVVRLDKREPARQKTFDEAGGELSSAFQEAESKRLESEWIQGLRQRYPVVEHKEALKDAFVSR